MILTQIQYKKISAKDIRTQMGEYFRAKIQAHSDIFEAIARQGTNYGGNCFPIRTYSYAGGLSTPAERLQKAVQRRQYQAMPPTVTPNRYSVVYQLKEQYHHLGCATPAQARVVLDVLQDDPDRIAMGVYDDKTELFDWDSSLRDEYEKSSMKEQGVRGEEIIRITQALRRRDSSWDSSEFRRPSFFS